MSLEPDKDWIQLMKKLNHEDFIEILSSNSFCNCCQNSIHTRIQHILNEKAEKISSSTDVSDISPADLRAIDTQNISLSKNYEISESSEQEKHRSTLDQTSKSVWSTMLNEQMADSSPSSIKDQHKNLIVSSVDSTLLNDGLSDASMIGNSDFSEEQKEQIRFSKVEKKTNFSCIEKIDGKNTNILEGLEHYKKVFNTQEQKKIVECVYDLQHMGQKGELRERTYSEPKKWMRGKGRVTLQFGCCYNYAVDKDGNPPGIIRDEEVDPLPHIFKLMIKRMVRWHILPLSCIPNSCIVNIYDEGDCIPPHIDHHDFLRPFCTVSFLTECKILFGSNLKIISPGEFSGPASILLPVGSVLVLNGKSADVAKHCIPGVPAKRISITFRKMDDSKLPYNYHPEPDLVGIKPLMRYSPSISTPNHQNQLHKALTYQAVAKSSIQQTDYLNGSAAKESEDNAASNPSFSISNEDFPALGSSNSSSRRRGNRA